MAQVKGPSGGQGAPGGGAPPAGGGAPPAGGGAPQSGVSADRGGAVGMGGMPAAAAAAKTELRSQLFAVNKLSGPLSENFPKQPEPYYTFSETFSYGPDMLEQRAAAAAAGK